MADDSKTILKNLFIASLFCFALLSAINKAWVSDDAFITFRYIQNFLDGKGLVYNEGERVEGYTNFLFLLLNAGWGFLGFDLVYASLFLGILFYGFLIILSSKLSDSFQLGSLNLVFVGICTTFHLQIFATSGLETMSFCFFLFWGLVHSKLENFKVSSLAFALAALSRPEGNLFLGFYCIFLFLKKKEVYCIFPLVVVALHVLFRYFYYGDLFPNTFYAKSDGMSYFSQGLTYWRLFFFSYPIYLLGFFSLFSLPFFLFGDRKFYLFQIFFPVTFYCFYVIWVGGDFMFSRFWIPILPYLLLSLSLFFLNMSWNRITIVFFLLCMIRIDPYKKTQIPAIQGIFEEYKLYSLQDIQNFRKHLVPLGMEWKEKGYRVAIGGSEAFMAYYLNPIYVLEASTGLTDRELARKKLGERGLVGHEKKATEEDLRKRKIDILLFPGILPNIDRRYLFQIKETPIQFLLLQPNLLKEFRTNPLLLSLP